MKRGQDHGCILISLPVEKFHKDAKDFAAQLRKHYNWITDQPVAEAGQSAFEAYLTKRILNGRGEQWIDRLELNVASRACEVLGLRVAKGSNSPLTGHGDADWMAFGVIGYDVLKDGPAALSECLAAMALENGVDGRFFGRVFGSCARPLHADNGGLQSRKAAETAGGLTAEAAVSSACA